MDIQEYSLWIPVDMQEKVLTSSDSPFSPGTLMSLTQLKCTRFSSSIAQLIQELHLGEALDGVISGFVSEVWAQGSLMARKSGARMPLGFQTDMCGWIFVVCCSCMWTALSFNISFSK